MAVITLAEAKAHLNITGSASDAKLPDFISSAEAAIVSRIGPLESTPGKTRRVRGGVRGLVLRTPLISVQSITPVNGTALDLSLIYVDTERGVIEYNDGCMFGARAYDVVYTAGYATVPDDLKEAVKELLRHLWMSQRGGSVRPGSTPPEGLSNTLSDSANTLPIRIQQLLAPYMRVGVA